MKLLPLTILLLAVFMLSMGGSYLQHRYYLRVVNRLAGEFKDKAYALASGRHKGRLRGAVAVLVVRRDNPRDVQRAMVMSGATLFARFRERPEIHGTVTPELLARQSKAVRLAVEDALGRGRQAARGTTRQGPDEGRVKGTTAHA